MLVSMSAADARSSDSVSDGRLVRATRRAAASPVEDGLCGVGARAGRAVAPERRASARRARGSVCGGTATLDAARRRVIASKAGADRTREVAAARNLAQARVEVLALRARLREHGRQIFERGEAEEVDVLRGVDMPTDELRYVALAKAFGGTLERAQCPLEIAARAHRRRFVASRCARRRRPGGGVRSELTSSRRNRSADDVGGLAEASTRPGGAVCIEQFFDRHDALARGRAACPSLLHGAERIARRAGRVQVGAAHARTRSPIVAQIVPPTPRAGGALRRLIGLAARSATAATTSSVASSTSASGPISLRPRRRAAPARGAATVRGSLSLARRAWRAAPCPPRCSRLRWRSRQRDVAAARCGVTVRPVPRAGA